MHPQWHRDRSVPRAGCFAFAKVILVLACAAALGGCASLRTFFGLPPAPAGEFQSIDAEKPARAAEPRVPQPPDGPMLAAEPRVAPAPGAAPTPVKSAASQPQADLWARVRTGMTMVQPNNARIKRELDWFARNQGYLDRVSKRASRYLYYVVEQIEKRGLPTEFALLPVIESAYQPFAYSRSGASGIWQFMRSTGKRYGLEHNWWYDGRRDITASTRAALDYLEHLHRMFDGDWLLAVAAYNSGEGTVKRAVRRNRRVGKRTDFWSLRLPRETRNYVPRLLAIARVVGAPARYGLRLEPIRNEARFVAVRVERQIDLALVRELAGISMDEVYKLNPGYSRWATAPGGPSTLLVPADRAARFSSGIQSLPRDRLITWRRHLIVSGETLGQIAQANHTSVSTLRQINGLNSTLIRAGRSLIVPVASRPLAEYTLSADARASGAGVGRANGARTIYLVRKGDSLWSIARRHQTSVRKLIAWNGIAGNRYLQPGQKLSLWLDGVPAQTTTRRKAAAKVPRAEALQHVRYTVRNGDSLWVISRRFRVSITALKSWNDLSEGSLLHPGQELSVYLGNTEPIEI